MFKVSVVVLLLQLMVNQVGLKNQFYQVNQATIKVKYDTKRPGPFEKNVTITSNSKEPSKVVKIKGVVEAAPVAPTPAAPPATPDVK